MDTSSTVGKTPIGAARMAAPLRVLPGMISARNCAPLLTLVKNS